MEKIEYGDPILYGGSNPDKPDFSSIEPKPQRPVFAQDATKIPVPPLPKKEPAPLGNEESQLRARRFQPGTSADEKQLDSIRQSGGKLMDQGFVSTMGAHEVDSLRKRYDPARGEAADIAWHHDSAMMAERTAEATEILSTAQKEIHAEEKPKPRPLPKEMLAPSTKEY